MIRSALVAAVVAALVAGGGAAVASSYINGRSIRPHSIPLNRLVARQAGRGVLRLTRVTGQEYVVQPGSTGFGVADCPRGEAALSGGFGVVAEIDPDQVLGLTSQPMADQSGWVAGFQDTGTTPVTVIAYALCTADAQVVAQVQGP